MRIVVTGANGWIGAASVRRLVANGHEVTGVVRSEQGAATVAALGATPALGTLEDVDGLRRAAAGADAVVHLGYVHDFSRMGDAATIDRAVIDALGDELAQTGGALVIASGVLGLTGHDPATEEDRGAVHVHPRIANAQAALDLAGGGVRSAVVRFSPTVHGAGDHGFVAELVRVARQQGVSAYVGEGDAVWPAVHRLDAADLVRRVVEGADAGTVWHAVAEEGVPTRAIAEAIGAATGLPVTSVAPEDAAAHFGWIGGFFGLGTAVSSAWTRQTLGWTPAGPTLLEDITQGAYTGAVRED